MTGFQNARLSFPPKIQYLFLQSLHGFIQEPDHEIILWHVDPLLGNDCDISSYTIKGKKGKATPVTGREGP
jgi:hypothetical protein